MYGKKKEQRQAVKQKQNLYHQATKSLDRQLGEKAVAGITHNQKDRSMKGVKMTGTPGPVVPTSQNRGERDEGGSESGLSLIYSHTI